MVPSATPSPPTPGTTGSPSGPIDPDAPPRWDLTSVFPSPDSDELVAEAARLREEIESAREQWDRHGIWGGSEGAPRKPDGQAIAAYEEATNRLNALVDAANTLSSYLRGLTSVNSGDTAAQARLSEVEPLQAQIQGLRTRYDAWLGSLDVDELVERSEVAGEHAWNVVKASRAARRQMSEAEESLGDALALSGSTAWSKLQSTLVSQLMLEVELPPAEDDGAARTERLPFTAASRLLADPDRRVREAAHTAAVAAAQTVEVPIAACLNGIKGELNVLNERRGWPDSLEPVLFANNVDRQTLDAMHAACRESFPDFQRYLKAKARHLGVERMAWWDLQATVGGVEGARKWSFGEARDFVVAQFGTYSPALAGMAERAFRERWVDAEPRAGKAGVEFCMAVRPGEPRVMTSFTGTFRNVRTLAHELGHAYHVLVRADRTAIQRDNPAALAETASTFCETIVTEAALQRATGGERLAILDGSLYAAYVVVPSIYARFEFERRLVEARRKRELSVAELKQLSVECFREVLGDAMDAESINPYTWATTPHYYVTGRPYQPFYNWPYTFGLLFGLGLYARYQSDPDGFRAGYDELLARTGMEPAADLGRRFGIDIQSEAFWRSSLDVLRRQIDELEALAPTT